MESVCGIRPGRDWVYHAQIGSRRRVSMLVLTIRRSILYVLLYCPGLDEGHMYSPELSYPCLYGEVGQSGFRLELPFYLDRAVADQPHCVMLVRALAPHH